MDEEVKTEPAAPGAGAAPPPGEPLEAAAETPLETRTIEPGVTGRRVRLADGRYMIYYEFERRAHV